MYYQYLRVGEQIAVHAGLFYPKNKGFKHLHDIPPLVFHDIEADMLKLEDITVGETDIKLYVLRDVYTLWRSPISSRNHVNTWVLAHNLYQPLAEVEAISPEEAVLMLTGEYDEFDRLYTKTVIQGYENREVLVGDVFTCKKNPSVAYMWDGSVFLQLQNPAPRFESLAGYV